MKIAIAQINTTIGDFEGNTAKILDFYQRAVSLNADLVVFPELAVCGYPPRDLLLRSAFVRTIQQSTDQIVSKTGKTVMVLGTVESNHSPGRSLFNSAFVIQNGKILQRARKTLLPTYDVFDEDRYFEPATHLAPLPLLNHKIGVTICEDIWNDEDFWPNSIYRRDPIKELRSKGADLILNISASPWYIGKEALRHQMLKTVSQTDGLPIIYVNAVGGNDELVFDGNSVVFGAHGECLATCAAFKEELKIIELNRPSLTNIQPAESIHHLFCALRTGLHDYVKKCGFRSVVLGLSGGIDSALTATIAVSALGPKQVMGIALPSAFSSEGSLTDAYKLSQNLGIQIEQIAIQPILTAFREALHPLFNGRAEDTTEENLQSRIRGVLLMALSNKFGSLLITTGNKSELATGYCTLYGDMCGGLAVISDLSKTQVYDLSRWINEHPDQTGLAPHVIPTDSITKPPSAELRPNQKDQDSLPPYDILDQILKQYVEQHEPISKIVERGFDSKLVSELTRKIDFNEYKRRQSAPGLKVSSKAFGIGRRIPLAQRYCEA